MLPFEWLRNIRAPLCRGWVTHQLNCGVSFSCQKDGDDEQVLTWRVAYNTSLGRHGKLQGHRRRIGSATEKESTETLEGVTPNTRLLTVANWASYLCFNGYRAHGRLFTFKMPIRYKNKNCVARIGDGRTSPRWSQVPPPHKSFLLVEPVRGKSPPPPSPTGACTLLGERSSSKGPRKLVIWDLGNIPYRGFMVMVFGSWEITEHPVQSPRGLKCGSTCRAGETPGWGGTWPRGY